MAEVSSKSQQTAAARDAGKKGRFQRCILDFGVWGLGLRVQELRFRTLGLRVDGSR